MEGHETYTLPDDNYFFYNGNEIHYIINPGGKNEKSCRVTGTKIKIIGIIRNSKSGASLSYKLQFIDFEGKTRHYYVEACKLVSDLKGVTAELAGLGFSVYNQRHFSLLLMEMKNNLTIPKQEAISKLGWNEQELAFTLPYITLKKNTDLTEYYFQKLPSHDVISSSGTLEDYNRHVIPLIKQDNLFIVVAIAGLSTIIQGLSDVENGGIHLYGDSSSGKTTSLQVYASILGSGVDPSVDPMNTSIGRFNATANGVEAKCALHSGIGLALDELGSLSIPSFGALIYDIAGGQGKTVMNRNRESVEPMSWDFIFISTGEQSIQDKILSNGEKSKQGMSVRIADTPISEIDRYSDRDISSDESRTLVESVKVICGKYYGTLGPAFIQYIIDSYIDLEEAKAAIGELITQEKLFLETSIPKKSNEVMRVLTRFALILVTGKLLVKSQLVDITDHEVEYAVQTALSAWIKGTNSLNIEDRGLENIRQYLTNNMHKIADIDNIKNDSEYTYPTNIAGYREGNQYYMLTDEAMEKARGDVDLRIVKKALRDRNHLHLHTATATDKRYKTRKTIPTLGSLSLYIIKGSFINGT